MSKEVSAEAEHPPVKDYSDPTPISPFVSQWWSTVALYSDQTDANITRHLTIAHEISNPYISRGPHLTRLSIQTDSINASSESGNRQLSVDHRHDAYLVLTALEVTVQDFCRAVCGFHYFTFPSIVGHTLSYAWVGNSGAQYPEVCAYPFAIPGYMAGSGTTAMRPPNGVIGADGMMSVIGHELEELATNPLVNAWYADRQIGTLIDLYPNLIEKQIVNGAVFNDPESELTFNMALILLPVCRNTITWLRNRTKLGVVVPFNDNLNFHKDPLLFLRLPS